MFNLTSIAQCCSSRYTGIAFAASSVTALVPSVVLPILMALGKVPASIEYIVIPAATSFATVATAMIGTRILCHTSKNNSVDLEVEIDEELEEGKEPGTEKEILKIKEAEIPKELLPAFRNLCKMVLFYKGCESHMLQEVKEVAVEQLCRYQSLIGEGAFPADLEKTTFEMASYHFFQLCMNSETELLDSHKAKYLASDKAEILKAGTEALTPLKEIETPLKDCYENFLTLLVVFDHHKDKMADESRSVAEKQLKKYIHQFTQGVDYPKDLLASSFSDAHLAFGNLVINMFEEDLSGYMEKYLPALFEKQL